MTDELDGQAGPDGRATLEVAALRGVLYDPERAGPLDRLLAPPYDVISPAEREALAVRSPHGIVHLILPAGEGDQRYAQAARLYKEWLAAGLLRRDQQPAIYLYHQQYQEFTRAGFICRVRL